MPRRRANWSRLGLRRRPQRPCAGSVSFAAALVARRWTPTGGGRRPRPRRSAFLADLARATNASGPALVAALVDDARPCGAGSSPCWVPAPALGEHLVRHPEHWRDLADPRAVHRPPHDQGSARDPAHRGRRRPRGAGAGRRRRRPRRRGRAAGRLPPELLRLAARDLGDERRGLSPTSAAELADLAAATLEAALAARPGRAAARRRTAAGSPSSAWASAAAASSTTSATSTWSSSPSRRRGGDEGAATRTGDAARAPGDPESAPSTVGEGTIWPVDAALRPEGKNGALVRTLASHVGLLRALGADLGVPGAAQGAPGRGRRASSAHAYVRASSPLVWRAAERAELRRGRAGDAAPGRATTSRPAQPTVSSSWAGRSARRRVRRPAAAARARPQRPGCAAAARCVRWRRSRRTATSAATTRAALDRGVPLPAHARAPAPAAAAAAHPRAARRRAGPACARPFAWSCPRGAGRGAARGVADARREVRRLHEKLFYRPLLAGRRPAPHRARPG